MQCAAPCPLLCSSVIPVLVVDHFLSDWERNQTFLGFPSIGIELQNLESAAARCGCGTILCSRTMLPALS